MGDEVEVNTNADAQAPAPEVVETPKETPKPKAEAKPAKETPKPKLLTRDSVREPAEGQTEEEFHAAEAQANAHFDALRAAARGNTNDQDENTKDPVKASRELKTLVQKHRHALALSISSEALALAMDENPSLRFEVERHFEKYLTAPLKADMQCMLSGREL